MGNKKSKASGKSGATMEAEQTSALSKDAGARRQVDIKMVQNVLLIGLDNNIDDTNQDCHNTATQLRRILNDVTTFTDGEECIQFVENINDNKVCMIISGSLGQQIVPRVHSMSQVDSVFIFCIKKKYHEQWTKEWPKIKGVFTEITPICEALKKASQRCEQNAISISFVPKSADDFKKNLGRLDPMFMYTQIMKEILLIIKFEPKHFKGFIDYCRHIYVGKEHLLKNLDKLEKKYHAETPIWWYTFEGFLYLMLNRALRMTDADIIIRMGFFIGDLHRQIEKLHKEQFDDHRAGKSFIVYRGQGLSKMDFEQMKETNGGLMSFNSFLSTSKDRAVSLAFAESNQDNPDLVGILFVMTIDPSKSTTPFASISSVSYYKDEEDEVLFSMHTVFRIHAIKPMDENHRLFQVDLTLTSENDDEDLRKLTDCMREQTNPNDEGWYRLGTALLIFGEFEKSREVYEVLLEQAANESDTAHIYHQIARVKNSQGQYKQAIEYYEQTIEIYRKTLPADHPRLVNSYHNIGLVYYNMAKYSKALSYYEKVLEIQQQLSLPNNPNLSVFYNSIGVVYYKMGEYSKALSYYEKALEIDQKSLPPNHPNLAGCYSNIGLIYGDMGKYSKALSYYEKALDIDQKSLLPNHPTLAKSYITLGSAYNNMGEYLKAIMFYEKALEIQQQSLPPNHPSLAASYNNIGIAYKHMGEYSKALSYYEKALEIQQQSLSPNHPDLAASYNNIGNMYLNMGDLSAALSYYEKALEIRQQSLPSNHPDLAASYTNIGNMYLNMDDLSTALSYYEKALEIRQQSLPSNHPDLAASYTNIENKWQTSLPAKNGVFLLTINPHQRTLSTS